MVIDGKYIDEENLVSNEKKFLKKYNNIYISEEQKNILDKYNIDVTKYLNVSELIYDIEEYLNDSYDELDDLEWVSQTISEYNYYNNTNK
jgi:hypothetical protein